MLAQRVCDLDVYKLAFQLQQKIFQLSKSFPKEEMYSLTDQIRRLSRSVGANMSEAWAKRRYPAHFVSKLSDADGEADETVHWLETAFACDYLKQEKKDELVSQYAYVSSMLHKMMLNQASWCKGFVSSK